MACGYRARDRIRNHIFDPHDAMIFQGVNWTSVVVFPKDGITPVPLDFTPDVPKFWSFVDPRQTFRTDSTPYVSVRGSQFQWIIEFSAFNRWDVIQRDQPSGPRLQTWIDPRNFWIGEHFFRNNYIG